MVVFNICDGVRVFLESASGEQYDWLVCTDACNRLPKMDYNSPEWSDLWSKARAITEERYNDPVFRDMFWELVGISDEAYYNANIADFLEYKSHMGEPDFDWGFYSDWHKDIYGFRPR